ncbi:MAG: tryptophan transporter [Halanaerobiaceae bacterium]
MRTKDLVQAALLVGIGFVLHAIVPGIFLGMKPDFALSMMFVVLILKRDMKLGLLVAVVTGIFTALTTSFPGGQIANPVDKMVTFLIISPLIPVIVDRLDPRVGSGIIAAVGTIISGTAFLGTGALVAGLPGSFFALFATVVLPAAAVNTVTVVVIFSVIEGIGREKFTGADDKFTG